MDVSLGPAGVILRSDSMAAVLAMLFERTDERATINAITTRTGLPQPTVTRVVNQLAAAGIITSTYEGRNRIVAADWDRPWAKPIADLLSVTVGVPHQVAAALSDVADVSEAHLFGSWVARNRGEGGPPPNDVDLLVIGETDFSTLRAALRPVEKRIGLAVNPVIVSLDEWAGRAEDPFLSTVANRPMLKLDLRR